MAYSKHQHILIAHLTVSRHQNTEEGLFIWKKLKDIHVPHTVCGITHPQDKICSIDILHVKLGGLLLFHLLYNLHALSNQHVMHIQHYINKMFTNLLAIHIVISLASHKSQSYYVCVKLLAPHPRRFLYSIKVFL